MRFLLFTVLAILVTTTANVAALKCYICNEVGTDACSKSKLESNQTKYSVDCGDLSDRCIRQENEVLDIKGINAACATQGLCESLKTACDKLDTCNDAACCDTDYCNAGSAVFSSVFSMAVCCIVGLVLVM
ncbi:hypothetical protein ABFA07_013146 [Porites harrisoni]